jgi:predicted nucleic acid-binding protein
MTLYYLDSSAWQQYYIRQAGSDEVAKLFTNSNLLACNAIGFVEVVAALKKKVQSDNVPYDAFRQKLHDLGNDWTQFIQIHSSQRVLNLAAQIVATKNVSQAQAMHLASILLLQRLNSEGTVTLTVVSADNELLAAAQSYGCLTINPGT